MTYGVGLLLDRGLVFMSDTRTNAGVDNIATVTKLRTWNVPGDRFLCLLSAGIITDVGQLTASLEEICHIQNAARCVTKLRKQ